LFVYTAADEYTFSGGTFLINFEASCSLTSIDFETRDTGGACSGNWRVNSGTGDYERLKGTGGGRGEPPCPPAKGARLAGSLGR
jgi:hypothetical protein